MFSGWIQEFDSKIRQRPEARVLVYFALILALAAIPYVIVVDKERWLHIDPAAYDSVLEGIFASAAVAAVFLMRSTPGAMPIESYGFRLQGIVTQTAIGAAVGLALMSAIMNVLRVTGHYVISGVNHSFSPVQPLILFLFVAIAEETIFRGFIFTTLEAKWGTFIAITTTSLLFGLSHLVDPVPGVSFESHLRSAIFIGVEAGILLNAAFILTRSLWLGIGIHWAWNFFEGPFYGTSVSGMDESAPLYHAHTEGDPLITGGAFGPEGGIVCLIICTLAGLYMLRLGIRAGNWRRNPEIELDLPPDTKNREEAVR